MNVYSTLPLAALFTTFFLSFYIIYINPRKKLNQLFGFSIIFYAIMALANFYMFNAPSASEATIWNKIETIGTVLSTLLLFHFSLVFCKRNLANNKLFLALIYLSGIFFLIIEFSTNFITENMKLSYWGYSVIPGPIYAILAIYLTSIIIISLLLCLNFYYKTSDRELKKQAKLLVLAFSFPIFGAITTQAIVPFISFEIMPLTAVFSTFTAFIISYSISKHSLMRPLSLSIQKKIVIMFFVLIFCMIFFSLSVLNVVSTEVIEDTMSNDLRAIAKSRANNVETIINGEKDRLRLITNGTQFQTNILEYSNNINEVNRNHLRNILLNANESIDDYKEIILLDSIGICIASTKIQNEDMSFKDERFYKGGRKNTSVYFSKNNSIIDMIISQPFIIEGKQLGTIVVINKPDSLFDIMTDDLGLGETGESYIVNESGIIITPSRFYNTTYNYDQVILDWQINTVNFRNCMAHGYLSQNEIANHHDEIEVFQDYRNVTVLGAHVFIADMNWALLIEIDEAEVLASVITMQNIITMILAFFGAISLVVAYYYAKSLSKPIVKLSHVADEITKGNLDAMVNINTSDEIGNLAGSFNVMTQSLKHYTENLEQQVEERTKDLQEKIDELQQFKKLTVGRELKMVELKNKIKQLEETNKTDGNQL